MTTPLELLHDLHGIGVVCFAEDGKLVAKPARRVTPELVARIRILKPEIVRILSGPSTQCEHCGNRVVRDATQDGYLNRLCVGCGRWFTCEKGVLQ